MKILWLSYYYLPHVGGGTWSTYNLSRALALKGHHVRIVVPNVRFTLSVSAEVAKEIHKKNLSTVYTSSRFPLPRQLGPIISFFSMFFVGIKLGQKSDIIVCQYHPHHLTLLVAIVISKILRRPIVARSCDVYRDMGYSPGIAETLVKIVNIFNESLIRYVDLFLVVCSENRNILIHRIGRSCDNAKIILSSNGFDPTDFQSMPTRAQARDSLDILPDTKVVLFVGRFSGEEYGTEVLLKAFSILLDKQPDTLLLLVGDSLSTSQQELITCLKIKGKIRLYGSIPHKDISQFIVASDVCMGPLMPTMAIPLKILEYMACGKPIVTGKGSVSVDLFPDRNFIVSPPQPEALMNNLMKILNDHDLANNLSIGNEDLSKKFSWPFVAIALEQNLIETINKVIREG